MNDLPENLFLNPVWHALHSRHRKFCVEAGDACRYLPDVAPFAALAASSENAMRKLHSILAPGDSVWLFGDHHPRLPELVFEETLPCLQMVLPQGIAPPEADPSSGRAPEIEALSHRNAPEMLALTDLAFPGFFRPRTCEMGSYYGVRSGGALVAMSGERLMLDGYPEISGVCTHPEHRGQGLAASLMWQLVRNHRRDGLVSWLHVSSGNRRAIQLYLHMGFRKVRELILLRVSRND